MSPEMGGLTILMLGSIYPALYLGPFSERTDCIALMQIFRIGRLGVYLTTSQPPTAAAGSVGGDGLAFQDHRSENPGQMGECNE